MPSNKNKVFYNNAVTFSSEDELALVTKNYVDFEISSAGDDLSDALNNRMDDLEETINDRMDDLEDVIDFRFNELTGSLTAPMLTR